LFVLTIPQAGPGISPYVSLVAKDPPMRHSLRLLMCDPVRNPLRNTALLLLGLSSLFNSGCALLNPNSKLIVNRGDYHDEWEGGGVERRASTEGMDHEDADGLDKWWYSPKYRAINRNLGVD
jgi:hypothetical protein